MPEIGSVDLPFVNSLFLAYNYGRHGVLWLRILLLELRHFSLILVLPLMSTMYYENITYLICLL